MEYRTHQDAHKPPRDRQWWPATYRRPGLPKHHVIAPSARDYNGGTCQVHRDDLRRRKGGG